MKSLVLLLLGVLYVTAEVTRYDGYKVYRVYPVTEEQNELMFMLENNEPKYNFWNNPGRVGGMVDIMVSPENQLAFVELMNLNGMGAEVFIDDVQERINDEVMVKGTRVGNMSWAEYQDINSIYSWLDELDAEYSTVETFVAGQSFEDRPIMGVKISFGADKRAVMIEGGIHAREWISPATVTYIINEILTSTDPRMRKIAESFDWYIIPTTNPDGYQYTITNNRMWRKTRTVYAGGCYGADGNRNFNFTWGVYGSSSSACADTYRGSSPFSEKEVQAIKSVIDSIGRRLDVYLAMHSYSQYILSPYGNTTAHLGNYDDLMAIARSAAVALQSKYGTRYTFGTFGEHLYRASGTSVDWVRETYDVGVAYTYELRDTGKYGFILPPDEILPNCEEVTASLLALFEEAERLGYVTLG